MTYIIIVVLLVLLLVFFSYSKPKHKESEFVGYGNINNFIANERARPSEAAYYNNLGGIIRTKEVWDFCKEIPELIHVNAQKWKAFENIYWGSIAALGLLYDYYFNQNLRTFASIAKKWVDKPLEELQNYFYWYRKIVGQNENTKIEPSFANFAKVCFAIFRSESGWSRDGTRFLMPQFVNVAYLESMQSELIKYMQASKLERFRKAAEKARNANLT